jgi:hypothetical protein
MFRTCVASVCFKCFICFKRMLHFKCFVFQRYVQRVIGAWHRSRAKGCSEHGPADGACGTPGVLRTGHARPHLGSRVLPAQRERRGSGERSDGHGAGETDGGGVHVCVRGETRRGRTEYDESATRFL